MKSIIFWDMTPCSPLSFNRHLEEHIASIFRVEEIGSANQQTSTWLQPACVACWFSEPISSTLKMEAICPSETSVETKRTTRRHIPEDDTLENTFS
jgi:hypothetical protein